ncbi:MAG TPA: hypothetical protein VIU82_19705 [Bosea sp. (in: a-proteobacteria)]
MTEVAPPAGGWLAIGGIRLNHFGGYQPSWTPCDPLWCAYTFARCCHFGGTTMPFSSLRDPNDLARAYAVMDAAWDELKDAVPEDRTAAERIRLAYLVAGLTPLILDDDELKQNVLMQFREQATEVRPVAKPSEQPSV